MEGTGTGERSEGHPLLIVVHQAHDIKGLCSGAMLLQAVLRPTFQCSYAHGDSVPRLEPINRGNGDDLNSALALRAGGKAEVTCPWRCWTCVNMGTIPYRPRMACPTWTARSFVGAESRRGERAVPCTTELCLNAQLKPTPLFGLQGPTTQNNLCTDHSLGRGAAKHDGMSARAPAAGRPATGLVPTFLTYDLHCVLI